MKIERSNSQALFIYQIDKIYRLDHPLDCLAVKLCIGDFTLGSILYVNGMVKPAF